MGHDTGAVAMLTRLTNGFSKKLENHAARVAVRVALQHVPRARMPF
jgi:hypothetical protein